MAILRDGGSGEDPKSMLVVGVTGGMGSGKSVVCDLLQTRGAHIFDADDIGKHILGNDADARREIVHEFGAQSYYDDGSLNRGYLASIVFADESRLAAINAIVHPRVFREFASERDRAAAAGVEILVHEAALLFESGGDRYVDCTVYVDAPRWLRIRRVMERDGQTHDQVVARMKHQLAAYKGRARADYVLYNDGMLDQLENRVDRLLGELHNRRSASPGSW